MNTNEQKLELVRFVFSTCILMLIFGHAVIERSTIGNTSYSRLCLDNIRECVAKADAICESDTVKNLVCQASGCDRSEVAMAMAFASNTIHKKQERISNLTRVFEGAKERLPQRKYEKIFKQMDDVDEVAMHEEFNFGSFSSSIN